VICNLGKSELETLLAQPVKGCLAFKGRFGALLTSSWWLAR